MVLEKAASGIITFIEKLHWTPEELRLPTTGVPQNKKARFLKILIFLTELQGNYERVWAWAQRRPNNFRLNCYHS